MSYRTYILYSEKFDKYYVGQTNSISRRLIQHNNGLSKATKPYKPWILALSISKENRSDAMKLERKLKNLSKARLKKFIEKYSD